MKAKLYFRADGNSMIGLGHVMRCLALADILGGSYESLFLIQNPGEELEKIILKICDQVISLPGTDDFESESEFIASSYLKKGDLIVLDGYNFDSKYQKNIFDSSSKIIFIDDIYAFHFFAHAIINHAGSVPLSNYSVEWHSRLFLGPQYAILRKPFLRVAKNPTKYKKLNSVFINMGGSDINNHSLNTFLQCKDIDLVENIYIVIGSAYLYKEQLEAAVKNTFKNVKIFINQTAEELVELMNKCGTAVCSSSTISYEYCCVGGLLFLLKTADNQKNIYDYLIKEGLAFPFDKIKPIISDDALIKVSLEKQKKIFDGGSLEKLKEIFEKITIEDKISIRLAEEKDLMLYFNWANDPFVRNNSINKEAIALEMHKNWFFSKIKDSNSYLYLFEWEKKPVGQVRFDLKQGQYLIGFSLDKDYRNRGLGEMILRKAIINLNKILKKIVLTAQVQKDNKASESIFYKLGFKLQRKEIINNSEFNIFELIIS